MNRYLGDVSVAPIRNGYAVIEFATCAITTRPASGQVPVTNDYLARRGKSTFNDCESISISGSIPDPKWPRVCMLNTDALVLDGKKGCEGLTPSELRYPRRLATTFYQLQHHSRIVLYLFAMARRYSTGTNLYHHYNFRKYKD
ncbi:uncharacterized protein LACBIDRAFT_307509 [Laccaria bicolor S238N-H82]|uniref:Predicted protein n=1 Tax=Laccaria bicolor (strain S238N-H82 / ATCC MYA-4686) TaxID=486041 RepID=B0DQB8_LACBS|nr:uncharacterized protein LACBIDRAFT_307509 [Laccaria bicolor S238N-H82]EDR03267.1 predicted protein [Laccaria bicolor S238N-H82]|eukprot:XP_001886063.1 predicted protein [Laccaria bicolor S238N-H82]